MKKVVRALEHLGSKQKSADVLVRRRFNAQAGLAGGKSHCGATTTREFVMDIDSFRSLSDRSVRLPLTAAGHGKQHSQFDS